ncbi:TIGR01440 family protein [Caproicibacter sp.]|uniref:TIGR01440 family protein n=1 Tax=Caproicibacter sp. TaxID=2814884 RepID=UPI0039891166
MLNEIEKQARAAVTEFLDQVTVKPGQILVIGCSSSEICGKRIGSGSSEETANAVFGAIYPVLKEKGIYLAAQCCEHLNRAIILEEAAAEQYRLPIVNAVPQPKAGGSFATAAYRAFERPVAVERVQAHAGMDIGDTLIGMHLRPVAVPVRLSVKKIGEANLVCARTRPKYIGGERAHYDPELG